MKQASKTKQLHISMLKDLYKSSDGLYSFTLANRYMISPKDMFGFIKKYKEKGYINYDNDKLKLNQNGVNLVFSEIFHNKSKLGLGSNLPETYLGEKIKKNTPYIPIINYLSQEFHDEGD